MRAMAEIQAEGLRAATALLERVLGDEPAPSGNGSAAPTDGYAALVDAWADMLRLTFSGLTQLGQPRGTVSLERNGVGERVRLVRDPADDRDVVAEVWLHNGTTSEVGPLIFRCSDLIDTEGTVLAGAELRFDPPKMEPLPSRSSRAVSVCLVTTDSPRPGTYRGTIQAQGAPGLWLPLEVAIEPC
jgi:hypothetical protein